MWHLLMAHQQESFHPFSSWQCLSCFLSHLAKRVYPKAAWSQKNPSMAATPGFKSQCQSSSAAHFRLLPQSVTSASIPVFFQLYWAAIVSPGRCGPMVWSQSSPTSHAGDVTRGSCLPVTSWVEITPISLAQSMATAV